MAFQEILSTNFLTWSLTDSHCIEIIDETIELLQSHTSLLDNLIMTDIRKKNLLLLLKLVSINDIIKYNDYYKIVEFNNNYKYCYDNGIAIKYDSKPKCICSYCNNTNILFPRQSTIQNKQDVINTIINPFWLYSPIISSSTSEEDRKIILFHHLSYILLI